MGKQEIKANFADILKVITNTIATTLENSSSSYSDININIQQNTDSKRCNNITLQNDNTQYYVSSTLFSDQSVTQDVVLTILQTLSDTQSTKNTGWTPDKQKEVFNAVIKDMLQTSLTSNNLVSIGQNVTDVSINVQKCMGSTGGNNIVIAKKKNIFKYYNNLYAQNTTIQSLAADLSNYISGTQSEKSTGLLVVIIRMIALIVIVICAVVGAGIVAVIVFTMKM